MSLVRELTDLRDDFYMRALHNGQVYGSSRNTVRAIPNPDEQPIATDHSGYVQVGGAACMLVQSVDAPQDVTLVSAEDFVAEYGEPVFDTEFDRQKWLDLRDYDAAHVAVYEPKEVVKPVGVVTRGAELSTKKPTMSLSLGL